MKNIIKRFHHWPFAILLAFFIALATLFSLTIPLDAAPDERAHFDLVRYIAEEKKPPLTIEERESVGYKGDASPIYHGLIALSSQYVDIAPLPQPHRLGVPELFIPFDTILNNRNFHTENELFPFRGIVLAWHLARLASIPMAATTMIAIYLTTLTIYPKRRYFALAVAGFAAFVPRFVINSAVINDDNLVIPFTAFSIYYLVRVVHGDQTRRTLIMLGIISGLAAVTKYHALVLLPEIGLVFLAVAWHQERIWGLWFRRWVWVMVGFILSAGGWFVFLFVRFNRIAELGVARGIMEPLGDPVVTDSSGLSLSGLSLAWDWMGPLFRSFWIALEGTRIFGPERLYLLLAIVSIIALLGLAKWLYTQFSSGQGIQIQQLSIGLLALHFLIYLAIVFVRYQTRAATGLGYSAAPHNIQGRHLYPALISIAFLFTLGLSEAIRSTPYLNLNRNPLKLDKYLALTLSISLIAAGVIAFFSFIRPTYLPYLPILTLQPEEVPISNRVQAEFAKGLRVIGYDIEGPKPLNDTLPVTLYWYARLEQERDYLTRLCLYDDSGEAVSCYQGHPADGLFPTRSWTTGHVIRDKIELPLPHCLAEGSYELKLSAFLIRDDLAATAIDHAEPARDALSLGSIDLPQPSANSSQDFDICTQNGCQQPGQLNLDQIRQSLTVVNYRSDRSLSYKSNVHFASTDNAATTNWTPLEDVVTYRCPNNQQISVHTFIVDQTVTPGSYRLEIDDQVKDTLQLQVSTRQRSFDRPPNLQTELNISFAGKLELLGYELDLAPRWPNDTIEATLYWQAMRTTDRNYVGTLHLLDNQLAMWRQSDHEIGGLYPNILWAPGEVVKDVHTLQNPHQPLQPGLYSLELGLYDASLGFNTLPMVSTQTGQWIENKPILGQVRIMDPARTRAPDQQKLITLNQEVQLLGYDLVETQLSPAQTLAFALHWQAIAAPEHDYTVFTQLIGPDGLVWSQLDNQPQGGRYPTTLWQIDDRVVDRYELMLKDGAPAGEYRLLVGMYNWGTGERLPALTADGTRLPDDAMVLTTLILEDISPTLP